MDDDAKDEMTAWDEAFDEFYDKELADEPEEEAEEEAPEEKAEEAPEEKAEEAPEEKTEEAPAEEAPAEEAPAEEAAEEKPEEDEEKNSVKEALGEFFSDKQKEEQEVKEMTDEAVKMLYPDGIADPRVDSDGDPITSAKQVESLINPATDELFTPEEARDWFNEATRQYEERLAAATEEAAHVVSVNRTLAKELDVVSRVYGDFIKEHPEEAESIKAKYEKTLVMSKDGSYIKDVPTSVLEFYNLVMQPRVEYYELLAEKQAMEKAAQETKAAQVEKAKKTRAEGADLPQSQPEHTGDDEDWSTAFDSYYGIKRR